MNRSSWRGRRGRPRQNHNEVDLREKINRLRRDKIPAIQDSPLAEDDDDQISLSLSLSSSDSICKQPLQMQRNVQKRKKIMCYIASRNINRSKTCLYQC